MRNLLLTMSLLALCACAPQEQPASQSAPDLTPDLAPDLAPDLPQQDAADAAPDLPQPDDLGAPDAAPDLPPPEDQGAPDDADLHADLPQPDDQGAPDLPEPDMSDCMTDAQVFQTEVWEAFMSRRCAGCHQQGGLAAQTRLVLTWPQDDPAWITQNLAALTQVARTDDGGLPELLARPSGRHSGGHTGGTLLTPDTADYRALARLTARLRGDADGCDRPLVDPVDPADHCDERAPGPRLLRRLTHAEYQNSVRDLTGVWLDVSSALAADTVVHGFDNNAAALLVSPLLADQYRTLAERVGERLQVAQVAPCGVDDPTDACAAAFIARFGQRAFRRPLTDDEQARYRALFDQVALDDGYDEAARWTVTALLQSPHFLYRAELGVRADGDRFALTAWELAAALSYLFWQTTPDDALLALAASGELLEPGAVEAQARRLLADPRSRAVARGFTWRWLGLDRLPAVTRDAALTPALRDALAQETERLLFEVWDGGGSLSDLLLADHTALTPALAQWYGLDLGDAPPDADGWRRVSLEDTPYGGLLTQGSLLATHALPTGSSPIHRGLMVRERFFCQELPPPPSNLDTSPPPVDPTLSTRARYAQHSDDPACSSCHDLIDPIGFGFEAFDGEGRWRARDGVHEIDARGELMGTVATDGLFEGVSELSELLSRSPDVESCYVEHWLRYGTGLSEPALELDCYVRGLSGDEAPADRPLHWPLLALVAERHFTHRIATDPDEQDVAYGEPAPLEPFATPDEHTDPDDPPPGQEGQAVTLEEQSRWPTGYCLRGVVRNEGDAPLTWSVTLEVEGTIYTSWESERTGDSGRVTFTGQPYNATLAPTAQATFGFCANL